MADDIDDLLDEVESKYCSNVPSTNKKNAALKTASTDTKSKKNPKYDMCISFDIFFCLVSQLYSKVPNYAVF